MEILENARLQIIRNRETVFFAALMGQTPFHLTEEIPTACTNGDWIKINPTWFQELTPDARVGLILHELGHIVFAHMVRKDGRDGDKWNIACDYAINNHLDNLKFELPPKGYIDHAFDDMTSEEIYDKLPDDLKLSPDWQDLESPSSGEGAGAGDSEESVSITHQQIMDKVNRAAQVAEMTGGAGSIPNAVKRALQEFLYPKLPWETLLQNYMFEFVKDDYSWKKRNRRYGDIYMPALHSQAIGKISVYIDCSGSVTDKEIQQYLSEIQCIKNMLNPKELELISFDTQIHEITTINNYQPLTFDLVGCGGTNLTEVAQRINKENADINLLFTDGYYRPVEYNKEVLHIIVGNPTYVNDAHPVIHMERT